MDKMEKKGFSSGENCVNCENGENAKCLGIEIDGLNETSDLSVSRRNWLQLHRIEIELQSIYIYATHMVNKQKNPF